MDLNIVSVRDHSAVLQDPLGGELHVGLVDPGDGTYAPMLGVESDDRTPEEVLG